VVLHRLSATGTHHLCRNSLLLLVLRSLLLKLLLGLHDRLNALLWWSWHWSAALGHTNRRQLLLLLLLSTCLLLSSLPLSLQHMQSLLLLLQSKQFRPWLLMLTNSCVAAVDNRCWQRPLLLLLLLPQLLLQLELPQLLLLLLNGVSLHVGRGGGRRWLRPLLQLWLLLLILGRLLCVSCESRLQLWVLMERSCLVRKPCGGRARLQLWLVGLQLWLVGLQLWPGQTGWWQNWMGLAVLRGVLS